MTQNLEKLQLEKAALAVAKTPNGKILLRWLLSETGFKLPVTSVNPITGDLAPNSTFYNEGRRSIWSQFRKLLPVRDRDRIESEGSLDAE